MPGYQPTAVAHGAGRGRHLRGPGGPRGDHRRPAGDRLVARGDVGAGAVAAAAGPGRTRVRRARLAEPVLRRPHRRRQRCRPTGSRCSSRCSATPGTPAPRSTCARRWGPDSPGCGSDYAVAGKVAVLGASLGGLTALLAGLHAPREVGAVFSQSGSFFQIRHDDRHDSVTTFPHYWRITQRVQAILDVRTRRPAAADRADLRCPRGERAQQRLDGVRARQGRPPGRPRRAAGPAQLHRLARRAGPAPHRCLAGLLGYDRMRPCTRSASSCTVPGTDHRLGVIRHGHWGRPVLVFPSEAGRAEDFGDHGMVAAVQHLVDEGRVSFFCVDSLDAWSWSDTSAPDRGARPPARGVPGLARAVGRAVDRRAASARPGADHPGRVDGRLPRGPLRLPAGGPGPARDRAVRQLRRGARGTAWGERGDATYFANPSDYVPGLDGDHLAWLRARLSVLLVVRAGRLGDPPHRRAAVDAAVRQRCCRTREFPTSSTCGATTRPTTGPGGSASSPTTYRGSSEEDRMTTAGDIPGAPDRTAARCRGGLADGLRGAGPPARRARATPRAGATRLRTERVTIEPFNLRDKPARTWSSTGWRYWYYHPREWLKKVALMDDVYLLNSPFTFQSMEKHSAYCALLRLGMNVPETVLVPYKNPVDNARWAYTSARYNRAFDLDAVAETLGLPDVHEAVRRRRLARGLDDPGPRGAAPGLRRVRRDADAPAAGRRRATTCSPAR